MSNFSVPSAMLLSILVSRRLKQFTVTHYLAIRTYSEKCVIKQFHRYMTIIAYAHVNEDGYSVTKQYNLRGPSSCMQPIIDSFLCDT
jgi:hypothetical protein